MRKLGWSVVLVALMASFAEAPGQGFGGGGFNYSRGRCRLSGGFLGGSMYCRSPCPPPCWSPTYPPWCGPRFRRATFVSIFAPPPQPPGMVFPPPPARPPPPEEPPAMPPEQPKKEEEKPKKPERGLEIPLPPAAKADPEEEAALQVRLGRESFKLGEYGLAATRFREGSRLPDPDAPTYFLLTQSLIALGKYHEAHDAILAGLARQPDWPASGFRPFELYDDVLEYSDHLQTLEEAAARHPNDPELLFVHGYALWFDGRADEASAAFRRAPPRATDAKAIDLFLRTLPPGETL